MKSKKNLEETPNKSSNLNELKTKKVGTVLVNSYKMDKKDFKISPKRKSIRRSVKTGKIGNISIESRIFSISPYVAPNYVREFKFDDEAQKKLRSSKNELKNKNQKMKEEKNDNKKEKKLEEQNIKKLRQLSEIDKLLQIEDEETQKELKEEANKRKEFDDEEDEKQKEIKKNEKKDTKNEDELNDEEGKRIEHSDNKNKLEKDKKDKELNKEKINSDELNMLIKGTIKELYEPKKIENIVYNKIIILMKCLSDENRQKFLDGLKQAIKTEEDEKRFSNILGETYEIEENEESEQEKENKEESKQESKINIESKPDIEENEELKTDNLNNLKIYREEEYPCHCLCHYGGDCDE